MVNKEGQILNKSNHYKIGRQHDYTVYKTEQFQTPSQVKNYFDLATKEQRMTFLILKQYYQ